ncbi:hypothetical protein Tco_1246036 [Tanacetum coccineum]
MTLLLNELELGVTGTIVVMICRMWDVHAATGRYLSTDFIMSDTQLKEGSIYLVKNFTVVPNKDEFHVIRFADFMLEFDGETITRKAFLKSDGFTRYPFQLVEIDELEPTNNKFLIVEQIRVTLWGGLGDTLIEKRIRHVGLYLIVITVMSVKLYNNRLYLSSTSSTLIVDDANIPLLMRLKTDDSLVDYPVIRYRLELEISDETVEAVVVMFDETARVFSTFTDLHLHDEEAFLGLPTALANIKVVTGEDVEEGVSSATICRQNEGFYGLSDRLSSKLLARSSLQNWVKKRKGGEGLEDSDAEASCVLDSQPKEGGVACSSNTRKRKRVVLDDLE